nr:hypothetical protein [uncultured Tateyamaria sp.]
MIAFGELNPPRFVGVVSSVESVGEQVLDTLRVDVAIGVSGKDGMWREKARNVCLQTEPSRREPFQRFLDQTGIWFVARQNLAAALTFDIGVAYRCPKAKKPSFEPRGHAMADLLCVLLAVMLRHTGQHVFDEAAVTVIAKLNGGALQLCAH